MASRRIEDLHEALQPLAQAFLDKCHAAGINAIITCTYRSRQEQDELYAQGRTKPGDIVTWAQGGESPHNATLADGTPAAMAFDVVALDLDGKPIWDSSSAVWPAMGMIGVELGLDWGGNWTQKRKDRPHFQLLEG